MDDAGSLKESGDRTINRAFSRSGKRGYISLPPHPAERYISAALSAAFSTTGLVFLSLFFFFPMLFNRLMHSDIALPHMLKIVALIISIELVPIDKNNYILYVKSKF